METLSDYNRTHVGKAWVIVGMTCDGVRVCASCMPDYDLSDPTWSPIFASDDTGDDESECDLGECVTAVRIVWLPVNQSCLVMWHDTRLVGPLPRADAETWCRDRGIKYV